MASLKPDIEIIRGDTASISFTVQGMDLTGCTVFFTAKAVVDNAANDAAAAITKTVTDHTNPTAGETVIPLTATDTNVTPQEYFYDIQIKKGDGTIISIPMRKMEILADITRRTT